MVKEILGRDSVPAGWTVEKPTWDGDELYVVWKGSADGRYLAQTKDGELVHVWSRHLNEEEQSALLSFIRYFSAYGTFADLVSEDENRGVLKTRSRPWSYDEVVYTPGAGSNLDLRMFAANEFTDSRFLYVGIGGGGIGVRREAMLTRKQATSLRDRLDQALFAGTIRLPGEG